VKLFLLFLDGVGIGATNPDHNPFFRANLRTLRGLLDGELPHLRSRNHEGKHSVCFGVDANLGVDGLPQSGTGQASIFTGENAARHFGKHFGPYIPTTLRPMVAEKNLFTRVRKAGKRALLVNAFPEPFFEYTQSGTRRLSATTFASLSAGLPLLTAHDLASNRAVSADFVRNRWPEMGHQDVLPVSAHDAGIHCASLVRENDFTVFDYWLPDHAGHSQDMDRAVRVLDLFDEFLDGVMTGTDLRDTVILGISDHGNIEDLRTKSHTRNPSLGFLVGRRREAAQRIRSLTDVAPFVSECLNISSTHMGG